MNAVEIHDCAQRLYHPYGDKAARNARKLIKDGQNSDAKDWNRVRHTIAQIRGAHYS